MCVITKEFACLSGFNQLAIPSRRVFPCSQVFVTVCSMPEGYGQSVSGAVAEMKPRTATRTYSAGVKPFCIEVQA